MAKASAFLQRLSPIRPWSRTQTAASFKADALAGLGGLIAFISHSVIVGFTAAAAVLIGVSQLGPALCLAGGEGGCSIASPRSHPTWAL